MRFMKHREFFLLLLFGLPFLFYAIYSYAQTDPNLVFNSNPLYLNFQQQMWQLGYHQRALSSRLYAVLILGMFAVYVLAITRFRTLLEKTGVKLLAMLIFLLVVTYPALSHDLFNYMFNARMVVKYQQDPHIHTALEFPNDQWVRFMNNVHTPAPYGYGWTVLSLIPYSVGFHKFNPTYFAFKLFMVFGFIALYKIQSRVAMNLNDKNFQWKKWLFFLNPLVLVETIGNVHNDVWMMAVYFGAFLLLLEAQRVTKLAKKLFILGCSAVLFVLSSSIKFATLALAPIYVSFLLQPRFSKNLAYIVQTYWADISAVLMLLPLLTARSQQFHPWYLIWSLSFLPFSRSVVVRAGVIGLSISSMLRYFPYLSTGGYTEASFLLERQITWIGGVVAFLVLILINKLLSRRSPMLE